MGQSEERFEREHFLHMRKAMKLFNEEKFWECHEELEHYWRESPDMGVRYVYWAIIQVATALFHHREGHLAGAKGQIDKAKAKFIRCEENGVETDLLDKALNWSTLKAIVQAIPSDSTLEDFTELSRFKFCPSDQLQ